MKINRLFLLVLLLFFLPLLLFSQSNTIIDSLLEEDEASWSQSVYMVLTAAELVTDNVEISRIMDVLEKEQWKIKTGEDNDPITLGSYSLLIMKAFNIPGGIMYKIFPGPRYAARELAWLGFIDGDKSPGRTLSGEEVIRILGNVLEWKGEKK